MEKQFDKESFLRQRKKAGIKGWLFLILGTGVLLDSGSPIPFPLVGLPSILTGLSLIIIGWSQYKQSSKLPLHEAILFAKQNKGQLTRTDLFLFFELSAEKTDELIQTLVAKGFIEPIDEELPPEQEMTYRILS